MSTKNLDLSTACPTSKMDDAIWEENNSGVNIQQERGTKQEEPTKNESGLSQIGEIIEDLQRGYLPTLTNLAHITSALTSSLHSNRSQVSPSERQHLYSLLVACLRQSATTTGLLQELGEAYRSPILMSKK